MTVELTDNEAAMIQQIIANFTITGQAKDLMPQLTAMQQLAAKFVPPAPAAPEPQKEGSK